ncbi:MULTISPECIES: Holliday junction branch migration protein RuvA [Alteromonadaceae]|jgi:Holliday junction DNA helicase RuvA|uniref:Holliday junction branch migration complex subunit RuvA n=1 Tax=Brumicola blandensis TaxID=3075611 RepID=A0AAW8QXZ2_9ALTE|nr:MULTISPECIES: Holliday junction branch migration protein RuvA [unclassified Alteromonas]MDT0581009.1 Holliday junction branch migration protein RuvA [Alteromonas sp. W409]MDT0629563.1 Holliday junction branch migration protein RuvA [Alteromonas sp. W364]
MIGRIRGTLISKTPPDILIDVQGVGYEIQLPMTSFYQLPNVGEEAIVYTHFVVREDAQLLFGFSDTSERALFRELIKANGVGPKLACTILSGMSAQDFMHCVIHEDVTNLVKLPGVGKKTAERLVVELKDKLEKLSQADAHFDMSNTSANLVDVKKPLLQGSAHAKDEALSALLALGYKPVQAEKVIKQIYQDGMTSEQVIRESLKSMV